MTNNPSYSMEDEPTYNIVGIGGSYNLGPFNLTVSMGNLLLLSEIDSPLVSETSTEGTVVTYEDAIQAIYVIAKGIEAVEPIMGIKQRLADLIPLKEMVKDNPKAMEQVLDRAEAISSARTTFIQDATIFYEENFVGFQYNEIFATLQTILKDVATAFEDLPSPDKDKSDDKSSHYEDKKKS